MKKAFESITKGINEAIEFEKGKKKLKTSEIVIPEVPSYSSSRIRKIRIKKGITQRSFARLVGVSPKTVEAWESGTNHPSGPASRLISLYEKGLLDNLLRLK